MVRVNLYEKKVIEPLTVSMNREWSYDVSYGTTHGSLNLYEIGPLTVPLGLLSILNKSLIFSSKYIKKIFFYSLDSRKMNLQDETEIFYSKSRNGRTKYVES